MVTVAAACLRDGWGILSGDNKERAVLAGNMGGDMGPVGSKGGSMEGENKLKKGNWKRKGLGGPNHRGDCADTTPVIPITRSTIKMIRKGLFINVPPFRVYYIMGKLNVVTNALKTVG